MNLNISFVTGADGASNFVCFLDKDKKLIGDAAVALDSSNNGFISNAVKVADFKPKFGETLLLVAPTPAIQNVLLVGTGDKELKQKCIESLAGIAFSKLEKACKEALILSDPALSADCDDVAARIAFGSALKAWHFNTYKKSAADKLLLKTVKIVSKTQDVSINVWNCLKNIVDGVNLTRTLVSEPANVIYPESFTKFAMQELLPMGVKVEVLGKSQLEVLGMGALLGVAQGSTKEPQLLVMQWEGSQDKPVAFVGKGITFDSGGIDLKPENGMEEMKYDMAGAATVVGLMKAVAANKLKKNVVCVAGLAENLPSGSAQKPGDIVKSMSGITIEVLNTDAEGRLTLADSLWYTQDRFKPDYIIDLATLTGAIVVSLGHEYAGLFSNDDTLSDKIHAAADVTGEKVWRMPMNDYFDSTIESDIADLKNLTASSVRGGSITAACFLKRFINNCKWAHIDIAGVESTSRELHTCNIGATGYGVRLLYQLLGGCAEKDRLTEMSQASDPLVLETASVAENGSVIPNTSASDNAIPADKGTKKK